MVNFIPSGYKEGEMIKPIVISRVTIENRKLVVCESGFLFFVFDFITGGKICHIDIKNHIGYTQQEYIEASIKKAKATIESNPDWIEVLDKLPIIN